MTARVLLVEDTPTQAEIAKVMLRDFGHDMQHAENGAQALAMAQEWQPDAILVDLMLPDFSGIELMRRLKAAKVDATCIVLTAHGSVNTAVEAMREGATDFLLKPYAAARLRVTLDNALEKRALRKELDTLRDISIVLESRIVVLNFMHSSRGLTAADVEATIGRKVDIQLPQSNSVPISTNQGVPLLQGNGRDPVAKQLRGLVDLITSGETAPTKGHRFFDFGGKKEGQR